MLELISAMMAAISRTTVSSRPAPICSRRRTAHCSKGRRMEASPARPQGNDLPRSRVRRHAASVTARCHQGRGGLLQSMLLSNSAWNPVRGLQLRRCTCHGDIIRRSPQILSGCPSAVNHGWAIEHGRCLHAATDDALPFSRGQLGHQPAGR